MERADAVYATLRGEVRDALGHDIARFKAALQSQNPQLIDAIRGELVALTHSLRGH